MAPINVKCVKLTLFIKASGLQGDIFPEILVLSGPFYLDILILNFLLWFIDRWYCIYLTT